MPACLYAPAEGRMTPNGQARMPSRSDFTGTARRDWRFDAPPRLSQDAQLHWSGLVPVAIGVACGGISSGAFPYNTKSR